MTIAPIGRTIVTMALKLWTPGEIAVGEGEGLDVGEVSLVVVEEAQTFTLMVRRLRLQLHRPLLSLRRHQRWLRQSTQPRQSLWRRQHWRHHSVSVTFRPNDHNLPLCVSLA